MNKNRVFHKNKLDFFKTISFAVVSYFLFDLLLGDYPAYQWLLYLSMLYLFALYQLNYFTFFNNFIVTSSPLSVYSRNRKIHYTDILRVEYRFNGLWAIPQIILHIKNDSVWWRSSFEVRSYNDASLVLRLLQSKGVPVVFQSEDHVREKILSKIRDHNADNSQLRQ